MSIACNKDVARFVAHNALFIGDDDSDYGERDDMLSVINGEAETTSHDNHRLKTPIELNGWRCESYVKIGKHKRINASQWFKGDKYVYVINESAYESIGEYDLGVISDTSYFIIEFCADQGFNCKIEIDDVIQHYY